MDVWWAVYIYVAVSCLLQALAAVPRVVESGGGFATCAPGGESAVAGLAVSTIRWLSVLVGESTADTAE